HFREYESRLKHIDELYQRAQQAGESLASGHQARAELSDYAKQHAELRDKAEQIKAMDVNNWREELIESSGPMAVWDILAQKLEDFIERHEK
ncbi:MAG: hypothetical protein KJO24_04555, partial [Gammaproteobacteria bacterium]|nr:hypothetical protein [Gammaproteobacteria bacterium]